MKNALIAVSILAFILLVSLIVTNSPAISVYRLQKKLDRKCKRKRNKNKLPCQSYYIPGGKYYGLQDEISKSLIEDPVRPVGLGKRRY